MGQLDLLRQPFASALAQKAQTPGRPSTPLSSLLGVQQQGRWMHGLLAVEIRYRGPSSGAWVTSLPRAAQACETARWLMRRASSELAEGVGFEPTGLIVRRFSRPLP